MAKELVKIANKLSLNSVNEIELNEAKINELKTAYEARLKSLMEECFIEKEQKEIRDLYKKVGLAGHPDKSLGNSEKYKKSVESIFINSKNILKFYESI